MTDKKQKNILTLIIFMVALSVISVLFFLNCDKATYAYSEDIKGASDDFAFALKNGKNEFSVSKYDITKENVGFLLQYSQADNPDVFWYPPSVSYTYNEKTGFVTFISWENIYDDFSEIEKMTEEFEKYSTEAINVCFEEGMTDVEKIISAHEYLTETVFYKMEDDFSFTAYSIFVRREGVCQGYSYAFKYLMKYAGIECHFVSSDSLNHGWNIVCLDGEYYHVDVTSDDSIVKYNNTNITTGRELHDKLLCSDETFNHGANDVKLWGDIPLPQCKSTIYDDAFFKNVVGKMEYIGGKWYYVEPNEYINGSRRVMKTSYKNGVPKTEVFMNMSHPVYSVARHGEYLYVAVKDTVYQVDIYGNYKVFCTTVGEIFGLTVHENDLYYGVYRKKSYALCGKILPTNLDCIAGMSLAIDSEYTVLKLYGRYFVELGDGVVKVTVGDVEKEISIGSFLENNVISVPLKKDQLGNEIDISVFCGEESKSYKTSVAHYCEKVSNGDFDEKTKNLALSYMRYYGFVDANVPENYFEGYVATVSDSSDEISLSSVELFGDYGIKLRFSVLGKAEFVSNREFEIEKDGIYYVLSVKPLKIYDLHKNIVIKTKGISSTVSILALAKQSDDETRKKVYCASEFGRALDAYRIDN